MKVAAVEESIKVKLALRNHINSRTKLIAVMKEIFEFVRDNKMYISNYADGNFFGNYNQKNNLPYKGFFFSGGSVFFGKFQIGNNKKRYGEGLMLQNDNIAYFGQLRGNKYEGQGLYFDQEESIQAGQLVNGYFTGKSIKTRKDGEIRVGIWKNDKLMQELNLEQCAQVSENNEHLQ